MLADDTRDYLLTKPASSEETPFGPDVLVYKVGGKMFASLTFEDDIGRTNLKCDPQRAINLRLDHPQILPGYHMNKKHWNTLVLDGSLKPSLVRELIDHSYQLVVSSLPKKSATPSLDQRSSRPTRLRSKVPIAWGSRLPISGQASLATGVADPQPSPLRANRRWLKSSNPTNH